MTRVSLGFVSSRRHVFFEIACIHGGCSPCIDRCWKKKKLLPYATRVALTLPSNKTMLTNVCSFMVPSTLATASVANSHLSSSSVGRGGALLSKGYDTNRMSIHKMTHSSSQVTRGVRCRHNLESTDSDERRCFLR